MCERACVLHLCFNASILPSFFLPSFFSHFKKIQLSVCSYVTGCRFSISPGSSYSLTVLAPYTGSYFLKQLTEAQFWGLKHTWGRDSLQNKRPKSYFFLFYLLMSSMAGSQPLPETLRMTCFLLSFLHFQRCRSGKNQPKLVLAFRRSFDQGH